MQDKGVKPQGAWELKAMLAVLTRPAVHHGTGLRLLQGRGALFHSAQGPHGLIQAC